MLFASRHIEVRSDHGTAELSLGFSAEPANALDLARLRELDAALAAVAASPHVHILVVRSAIPAGFCAGIRPDVLASLSDPADRAAFAWYGQQVFGRLARLEAVSVAYIEGPCHGAGLELALACDQRVCVSRPGTHLGFPERRAFFGGTARLRELAGRRGVELLASGQTLSGREAMRLGIVDAACCERRAKIELRNLLDQLELRAVKPRRSVDLVGLAAERGAFAAVEHAEAVTSSWVPPVPINPVPPFPCVIGLFGNDSDADRFASEVALRGGKVLVCGDQSRVFAGIATALKRGFVTPLEAEQAWRRVLVSDSLDGFEKAGLVFASEGQDLFRLAAAIRQRTIICEVRRAGAEWTHATMPSPGRLVQLGFSGHDRVELFPGAETSPDSLASVAAWLKSFGLATTAVPAAARLLHQAA